MASWRNDGGAMMRLLTGADPSLASPGRQTGSKASRGGGEGRATDSCKCEAFSWALCPAQRRRPHRRALSCRCASAGGPVGCHRSAVAAIAMCMAVREDCGVLFVAPAAARLHLCILSSYGLSSSGITSRSCASTATSRCISSDSVTTSWWLCSATRRRLRALPPRR